MKARFRAQLNRTIQAVLETGGRPRVPLISVKHSARSRTCIVHVEVSRPPARLGRSRSLRVITDHQVGLVNDLGVLHKTLERDPVDLEYIGEDLDSGEISKSLAN